MLVKASTAEKGGNLIRLGLLIQIAFFALFILTSIFFHFRLHRTGTRILRHHYVPWKKHQIALYIGSLLIFVRSIFRYVEYKQGSSGTLLQHEFWSYAFDAALMVLVMGVFNAVHPAEIGGLIRRMKDGYGIELVGVGVGRG
jgi:hypothetical protein